MKLIESHTGKKKGETGVTIHVYSQHTKPMNSRSLTIHGLDVELAYSYLKFFFRALQMSDDDGVKILINKEVVK